MSSVDLLQPILDRELQRNNFFNGRLLSAEDLRAEQNVTRFQHRQLANAIGDGVAWGLTVSLLSVGPPQPRVTVGRGLALNRAGDLLYLRENTEVTLIPAARAEEASAGVFAQCESVPGAGASLSGEGIYVFVASPASGFSGTALVSDPNTVAVGRGACGARFSVEGVRFRLVPMALPSLAGIPASILNAVTQLLPPEADLEREQLRNLLAHACLGTDALGGYYAGGVEPVTDPNGPAGWGALDAMRARRDLTNCDVPLALVVMTGASIGFVDMWSARRRLWDAWAIDAWRAVASPRRPAEGEAAFLQFQSQLQLVKGLEPTASIGDMAAAKYFHYLPAAGWLPTGPGGFGWKSFLGPHAPPQVTPIDAALVRGVFERSWLDEPFSLASDPPVPLRVYEVPQAGQSYVVFARSRCGHIRVVFAPPPPDTATVEVQSRARIGAEVRSSLLGGGRVPLVDLVPGPHTITVTAPDYEAVAPLQATAIGGRTVDLSVALVPLPNGVIAVTAIDKATNGDISTRIGGVSAAGGGLTRAGRFDTPSGTWLISDLPPGPYTVTGAAAGYKVASSVPVTVARGEKHPVMLIFERDITRAEPPRCVRVATVKQPALADVRLCLVLQATEFEDAYFYGGRAETVVKARIATGRFRAPARASVARKRVATRFSSETGELVYTLPPWFGMVQLEPENKGVQKWLLEWREWFADELGDQSIRKSEPAVYLDAGYVVPKNVTQVRDTPPGYAVFGRFGVPLQIKLEEIVTRGPVKLFEVPLPGLPREVLERFEKAGLPNVDDIAWSWGELIADITGGDPEEERYLIVDALEEIPRINDTYRYYAGVDSALAAKLKAEGFGTDVAIANADPEKLKASVGSLGFAIRLIQQAQRIVSKESWSLEGLGLTDRQVEDLGMRGIRSKGSLVERARTTAGKAELTQVLGLDAEPVATKNAVITALTNEAVSIMTRTAVERLPATNLATWSGLDATATLKFNEAGFTTVDDLAEATPETLAAAGDLSTSAAEKLLEEARTASRAGQAFSAVASLSANEAKKVTTLVGGEATVGGIVEVNPSKLATALGRNVGTTTALITGLKAGLARRSVQ